MMPNALAEKNDDHDGWASMDQLLSAATSPSMSPATNAAIFQDHQSEPKRKKKKADSNEEVVLGSLMMIGASTGNGLSSFEGTTPSPATQTLNQLSQSQEDAASGDATSLYQYYYYRDQNHHSTWKEHDPNDELHQDLQQRSEDTPVLSQLEYEVASSLARAAQQRLHYPRQPGSSPGNTSIPDSPSPSRPNQKDPIKNRALWQEPTRFKPKNVAIHHNSICGSSHDDMTIDPDEEDDHRSRSAGPRSSSRQESKPPLSSGTKPPPSRKIAKVPGPTGAASGFAKSGRDTSATPVDNVDRSRSQGRPGRSSHTQTPEDAHLPTTTRRRASSTHRTPGRATTRGPMRAQSVQQLAPPPSSGAQSPLVVLKTYPSLRQASQATGIPRRQLALALLQERPLAGGYAWRYTKADDDPSQLAHSANDNDRDDDDEGDESSDEKKQSRRADTDNSKHKYQQGRGPAARSSQQNNTQAKGGAATSGQDNTTKQSALDQQGSQEESPPKISSTVELKRSHSPPSTRLPQARKVRPMTGSSPSEHSLQSSLETAHSKREEKDHSSSEQMKENKEVPQRQGIGKILALSHGSKKPRPSPIPKEKLLHTEEAPREAPQSNSGEGNDTEPFNGTVTDNTENESKIIREGTFEVLWVTILQPGALGVSVAKKKPPDDLRQVIKALRLKDDFEWGCHVETIAAPSIAQIAGLKVGDWLFQRHTSYRKGGPDDIVSDYTAIRDKAKSGIRPLEFCVARVSGDVHQEKPGSRHLSTTEELDLTANAEPVRTTSNSQAAHKIAPFCALCVGRSSGATTHHAWCHMNPHFRNSGANEVLARIKKGVTTGCAKCIKAHEKGFVDKALQHSASCLAKEELQKSGDSKHAPSSDTQEARTSKGRTIKRTERSKNSESILPNDGDDTDSDGSIFQFKGTARPRPTLAMIKEKRNMEDGSNPKMQFNKKRKVTSDKAVVKAKAPINRPDGGIGKPSGTSRAKIMENLQGKPTTSTKDLTIRNAQCQDKRASTKRSVEKDQVESETLFSNGTVLRNEATCKGALFTPIDSDVEDESPSKLHVLWEAAANPWGLDAHNDADVILFHSFAPGHAEALLPSKRFELAPFETTRYQNTHKAPEEGLHVLLLVRDAISNRPWGFDFCRHEFGGACLVKAVDAVSPASSGTFLGLTTQSCSRTGLNHNDMILAINGKSVGGMTEEDLRMELELCGPELFLVISRYKNSASANDAARYREEWELAVFDQEVNKDCRLDWADVNVTVEGEKDPGLATKPPTGPMISPVGRVVERDKNDKPKAIQNGRPLVSPLLPDSEEKCSNHSWIRATKLSQPDPLCQVEVLSGSNEESLMPSRQAPRPSKASSCEIRKCSEDPNTMPAIPPTQLKQAQSSEEVESEWEDDGNAWCGCVCGEIHWKCKARFWLQCDLCQSWYDVSPECVKLTKEQAESISRWTCWGCPGNESGRLVAAPDDKLVDKDKIQPTGRPLSESDAKAEFDQVPSPVVAKSGVIEEPALKVCTETTAGPEAFPTGSLVFIQEHGWAGVNNSEGVARVLHSFVDDEGDLLYDVKYIVGGTKRGILAEYVSPHSF